MAGTKRVQDFREYLERMITGDRLALAKLVTLIENNSPHVPEIMERVYPMTGRCRSLGITGPPGAGKSTLVDGLIERMRSRGRSVGVIAIDPSSPFSGGAVLGDRIRMQRHAVDEDVFIRSFGTRGNYGGLSRATGDVIRLFDAFGLDVVMVETVGVGQTELDVMNAVDTTLVILVPESGDTVQTMKAGLMEIADIFVVNKADRDGADQMIMELKAMVDMKAFSEDNWRVPVLACQANQGRGIDAVVQAVSEHQAHLEGRSGLRERRAKDRRRRFRDVVMYRLQKSIEAMEKEDPRFQAMLQEVSEEGANPYRIAKRLFEGESFLEQILKNTNEST